MSGKVNNVILVILIFVRLKQFFNFTSLMCCNMLSQIINIQKAIQRKDYSFPLNGIQVVEVWRHDRFAVRFLSAQFMWMCSEDECAFMHISLRKLNLSAKKVCEVIVWHNNTKKKYLFHISALIIIVFMFSS